ncbi:MAG TPA: hypothetical protein VEX86_03185 [Longimicrobium sp.]|nr:hypothetical protein [Longimicrobium sp.]
MRNVLAHDDGDVRCLRELMRQQTVFSHAWRMAKSPDQKKKRYRTSLPPPPPLPEYHILADVDDPLARLLLRGVRDIREWVLLDPGDRAPAPVSPAMREGLVFASAAHPSLARALAVFSSIREAPRLVSAGELIQACVDVRIWAEERGLVHTAIHFAETAAALDLDNPILACDAGRAARRAAAVERAEAWFDRAEKLGARNKNKRELIRALLGHGNLMRELGRFAEARAFILRASKMASSTRRYRQAAEAAHDLLCIAIEEGTVTDVEEYVETALRTYPIHHPSIPRFVHDWSFHLIRQRLYAEAVPLLAAIVPGASRPELKLLYSGTLARAAAGAGRVEQWKEASDTVLEMVGLIREFAAASLANVAEGSRFFGDWERGERCARRAIEIARERKEADVLAGSKQILTAIRRQVPPETQARPADPERVEAITARITALLHQRQKPARRPVATDRDRHPRQGRENDPSEGN